MIAEINEAKRNVIKIFDQPDESRIRIKLLLDLW